MQQLADEKRVGGMGQLDARGHPLSVRTHARATRRGGAG